MSKAAIALAHKIKGHETWDIDKIKQGCPKLYTEITTLATLIDKEVAGMVKALDWYSRDSVSGRKAEIALIDWKKE